MDTFLGKVQKFFNFALKPLIYLDNQPHGYCLPVLVRSRISFENLMA